MNVLEFIDLNESQTEKIIEGLQQLLADYQILHSNIRGIHWNIRGNSMAILRDRFADMCTDAQNKATLIAERIRTLGAIPSSKYNVYLSKTQIHEVDSITSGCEAMKNILETYRILIPFERKLIKTALEAEDYVTSYLLTAILEEQERTVWMMAAYMS